MSNGYLSHLAVRAALAGTLRLDRSDFAAGGAPGALIATLTDPYRGQGRGTTVYTTFGTVPGQLSLSGNKIVAGSAAAIAGNRYSISVQATSGDGRKTLGETFSLPATGTALQPLVIAFAGSTSAYEYATRSSATADDNVRVLAADQAGTTFTKLVAGAAAQTMGVALSQRFGRGVDIIAGGAEGSTLYGWRTNANNVRTRLCDKIKAVGRCDALILQVGIEDTNIAQGAPGFMQDENSHAANFENLVNTLRTETGLADLKIFLNYSQDNPARPIQLGYQRIAERAVLTYLAKPALAGIVTHDLETRTGTIYQTDAAYAISGARMADRIAQVVLNEPRRDGPTLVFENISLTETIVKTTHNGGSSIRPGWSKDGFKINNPFAIIKVNDVAVVDANTLKITHDKLYGLFNYFAYAPNGGNSDNATVLADNRGMPVAPTITNSIPAGEDGPLTITGTPPANATVGEDYSFSPVISGGMPGDDFRQVTRTGTLPPGLTLHSYEGKITGKPTTTGTYSNIQLTVTGRYGSASLAPFGITVAAAASTNPIKIAFAGSSSPGTYLDSYTGGTVNTNVKKTTDGTTFATLTSGRMGMDAGNAIYSATGRPVHYIAGGAGGTTLANWEQDGSEHRANMVSRINAAGGCDLLLLQVGFNDVAYGVVEPLATKLTKLRSLIGKLRSETNQPNLTVFIGGTQDRPESFEQILFQRQAEMIVANSDSNVRFAFSTYDLATADGIHQTEASHVKTGARFAAQVVAWAKGIAQARAPRITGTTAISPTVTDVSILHTGGTDFTPATGLTGFVLKAGATDLAISAAVRQNATTVRLTHASTNNAPASLLYNPNGLADDDATVLRDNSAVALPMDVTATALTVVAAGSPLSISGTPAGAAKGQPYTFSPTVSGGMGGAKTFGLTGVLPAGLTFAASTGTISGTPTSASTATNISITVIEGDLSAVLGPFSITVATDSGEVVLATANEVPLFNVNGVKPAYISFDVMDGNTAERKIEIGIAGKDSTNTPLLTLYDRGDRIVKDYDKMVNGVRSNIIANNSTNLANASVPYRAVCKVTADGSIDCYLEGATRTNLLEAPYNSTAFNNGAIMGSAIYMRVLSGPALNNVKYFPGSTATPTPTPTPPPSYPAGSLFETFSASDGSNLTSRTSESGHTWSVPTGAMAINGGAAHAITAPANAVSNWVPATSGYTIKATFVCKSVLTQNTLIRARIRDDGTYWWFGTVSGAWGIGFTNNGSSGTRATAAATLAAGSTYDVEVRIPVRTSPVAMVELWINGIKVCETPDDPPEIAAKGSGRAKGLTEQQRAVEDELFKARLDALNKGVDINTVAYKQAEDQLRSQLDKNNALKEQNALLAKAGDFAKRYSSAFDINSQLRDLDKQRDAFRKAWTENGGVIDGQTISQAMFDGIMAGADRAREELKGRPLIDALSTAANGSITARAQLDRLNAGRDFAAAKDALKSSGLSPADQDRALKEITNDYNDRMLRANRSIADDFTDRLTDGIDDLGRVFGGVFGNLANKLTDSIRNMQDNADNNSGTSRLMTMISSKLGDGFKLGSDSMMDIGKGIKNLADPLKDLKAGFGKNGDIVKGIGSALGGAMQGYQVGSAIGDLGSALGLGKGFNKGSKIGGSIGGLTGNPIIAAGASVIGGLIGSVFSKPKFGTAVLGGAGEPVISGRGANAKAAATGLAGSVQQGLLDLAAQLGGSVGNYNVSIGTYKDKYRVSTTGYGGRLGNQGSKTSALGIVDFGKDGEAAAIAFAIKDAIADGAITGLAPIIQKALSGLGADAAIQFAKDWTAAMNDYQSMIDPIGAAVKAVVDPLKTLRETMVQVGASTEDLTKLDAYRSAKLQELLKDQLSSLNDFRKALSGEGSGVTALDRLNSSLAEFRDYQLRIANGDASVDQSKFTSLGQDIFSQARDVYGTSTSAFQSIRAMLIGATDGLSANVTNAFNSAAGGNVANDNTSAAIAAQTSAIVSQQVIQTELLKQNNALLQQQNDLLARGSGSSLARNGVYQNVTLY